MSFSSHVRHQSVIIKQPNVEKNKEPTKSEVSKVTVLLTNLIRELTKKDVTIKESYFELQNAIDNIKKMPFKKLGMINLISGLFSKMHYRRDLILCKEIYLKIYPDLDKLIKSTRRKSVFLQKILSPREDKNTSKVDLSDNTITDLDAQGMRALLESSVDIAIGDKKKQILAALKTIEADRMNFFNFFTLSLPSVNEKNSSKEEFTSDIKEVIVDCFEEIAKKMRCDEPIKFLKAVSHYYSYLPLIKDVNKELDDINKKITKVCQDINNASQDGEKLRKLNDEVIKLQSAHLNLLKKSITLGSSMTNEWNEIYLTFLHPATDSKGGLNTSNKLRDQFSNDIYFANRDKISNLPLSSTVENVFTEFLAGEKGLLLGGLLQTSDNYLKNEIYLKLVKECSEETSIQEKKETK